jgi:hypothetical protein
MKRTVFTFGLIAGAIMAAMMLITMVFMKEIGFDKGEIIGYTTMVLAFLMTFFGIKSYRDNVAGGAISFGRALTLGLMITGVATLCYVATWEVIYYKFAPDFGDRYAAYSVEKAKQSGATQAQVDAKMKQMADFKEMYKNPFVNAALTFLEPLPVGLLVAVISAALLRRKVNG